MKTTSLLIVFIFCAFSQKLDAQSTLVDQSYTPPCGCLAVQTHDGENKPFLIGQEFTPSLPLLNFVDLSVQVFTSLNYPLSLYAEIHADTFSGPLLGTASPITYSQTFAGEAHLEFPTTVSITSGQLYVLRLDSTFAPGYGVQINLVPAGAGPGYDKGRFVFGGLPQSDGADLWFREGIAVPEPSTLAVGGLAILITWLLRRRLLPRA